VLVQVVAWLVWLVDTVWRPLLITLAAVGVVALWQLGRLSGALPAWAEPARGRVDATVVITPGGIAAALGDDDSPELHAADTMRAGDGLCDGAAVRVLVEEGVTYVRQLAEWGTKFDVDASGRLALGREAAHSVRRTQISRGAQDVIRKLQQAGYKAFVVGGAVRDLLLGITPKDFDIATNATPEQVKPLFRRAFIIGRSTAFDNRNTAFRFVSSTALICRKGRASWCRAASWTMLPESCLLPLRLLPRLETVLVNPLMRHGQRGRATFSACL
jgi:hypothetical protein